MVYHALDIEKDLSAYVESVFYFRDFHPDHSIERVVPTGHVFLLIELDDLPRFTYENIDLKEKDRFTKAWISGTQKDFLSISAPQKSSMMVVQFKPLGAYPILKTDLSLIANKVIDAELVFKGAVLELRKLIINSVNVNEKFACVCKFLNTHLDRCIVVPSDIISLFDLLITTPFSKHKEAIGSIGYSQKHIISQFKKYHGLTPKLSHRILRFNRILNLIQNKTKVNWTDISYQCGFSDQSHFIKEFQQFCGINPSDFIINNHNDELNFFPIA
ncbi:helix-turn-helix domain-containing protein [Portibacter lacus]|uniref:HTH araC/xylS-type domain-containing protein n=1 Tax=Portibacter lacus TaxID=1099794 RepID=A0AA37SL50_9BACT|nr:AraC family transcriptional regulator [Portibacter lacus]GLR15574.1 hypothetical protein GCM10007940_01890 [Portibacter lacus]